MTFEPADKAILQLGRTFHKGYQLLKKRDGAIVFSFLEILFRVGVFQISQYFSVSCCTRYRNLTPK